MWDGGKTMKRLTALVRIILVLGLTALCGYLAVLMVQDRLPWATPQTHHFRRSCWYVWGGRLFVHHSFDFDGPESATREFRIGGMRAKREMYAIFPDDSNGEPDLTKEPTRYVATITVQIPTWPVLILLGLYPSYVVVFARKQRRERRRRRGLCITCGYNLTGNTTGVCPECGTKRPELKG